MKHRWLALLLAACMLSGCQKGGNEEPSSAPPTSVVDSSTAPTAEQEISDTLKIAYNNADSLVPYQLYSTMNQNVISLLYDPLVKLDASYTPVFVLAQDVRLDGLVCTVTLKAGVSFSDGTPLTAQDVVYSAQQVRMTTGVYRGQLSNVETVTAKEDGTIEFKLIKPDRLFINLLTFPIVKMENPAVGCGRYRLETGGETPRLMANTRWHGGNTGRIRTVDLVNQLDKDTLIYSLKLGTINYAYSDPSGGESLSLGISTQEVPLNQLVYLGVNSTKGVLASAQVRAAIYAAVDRETLADQVYGNHASAAYAPFHPRAAQVAPQSEAGYDLSAARALIEQAGYTQKDSEGYYVTEKGRLRLRLLVNVDNSGRTEMAETIRSSLQELGIEVVVDGRLFDGYKTALAGYDFELYLGTVRIYDNMDITFMLSPKGSVGYGVTESPELLEANTQMMAGALSTEEFTKVFYEHTPFIPLLYRSAVVAFSRGAYFNAVATEQDIFYNIENW